MRIGKQLRAWSLVACLLFVARFGWAQIEVKEIQARPGASVPFLYAKAEGAVASAVLFQGGAGNIGLFPNGSMREEGFLSGGAQRFLRQGISVVIPDKPSDRRNLGGFRHTPEHAQDIAALIAFLRTQSSAPVWLIGISNGSLSTATGATLIKEGGPDGLVMISSVTKEGLTRGMAHSVQLAALTDITVPVLVVHHKTDPCYVSPYSGAAELVGELKSAKVVELMSIEGGSTGNPCHAGHHQFQGIEEPTTEKIATWIKQHAGR